LAPLLRVQRSSGCSQGGAHHGAMATSKPQPGGINVELWPIERPTPYARNARIAPESAIAKVAASIKEFGWRQPIVVDEQGVILAGHTRLLAAQRLGLDQVPVHVAVGLTAAQARAFRLMDNRSAQETSWDPDLLPLEFADLGDYDLGLTGFEPDEIAAYLADPNEGRADPNEVPEPPAEPITKPGDLWLLGEHRVLCGDATAATDVERLMGGAMPVLMVTDPPYGVDYDPSWRTTATGPDGRLLSLGTHRQGEVNNDDRADWREAWSLFPGDVAYIWHGGLHARTVVESVESCGFALRSQIVWMKQSIVIGRGHYHWRHEPCLYAVRSGKTAHWCGDHKQSTIWEIANAAGNGERDDAQTDHSAQKPVECMARPLRNHEGDVYDPFLGSGTTLIAAEQLGRICYGMEIAPRYCDVIVKRWENFTGAKAVLDDGQR
jgi:DNA modification methylase